ncbi:MULTISPECIES: DUF1295 domain-containing protein [Mesorhizobium]|uniref:DUF1295 domain-containing protein n=1 Tax=Mesorhizobium denitrificans TaxID=2294114 RepID=A0A371XGU2_9HYPH|nr:MULTISPECIES: DUF1295 domain-containing protein [Mesorhizobium]RFC68445.1 DUF1295 domain-containing protein [Mesorhizobium denitrificans]
MCATAMFFAVAVLSSLVMCGAWLVVAGGSKFGWIDASWSFLVGLAGVVVSLFPIEGWEAEFWRRTVVATVALAWSLRLGLHIVSRTLRGKDDPRYVALKAEWGANWRGRLFWFLQIQAAVALLLAVTIFMAARNPQQGLHWSDLAGLTLLVIAVVGEGIADAQLSRFARNTNDRDAVCDAGLWSLSRHPNYFFQWLGWLGYAVVAIGPSGTWPWGWCALLGPLMMYLLLTRASGIPPLEKHMMQTRGAAYAQYQKRVNAFWPGFQRSGSTA